MIRGRKKLGAFVDPACPLDWAHPLNIGVLCDFSFVPNSGWRGGNTFRDLVRGGRKPNDGVLTSGPAFSGPKDMKGSYGLLDTTSAGYVSCPLVTNKTSDFTIACKVRNDSRDFYVGVIFYNGASGSDGWGFFQHNGGGGSGRVITVLADGVSYNMVGASYTPAKNAPFDLIFTRDAAGNNVLYVDGLSFSIGTQGANTPSTGTGISATSTGGNAWAGWLDRCIIHNRALNAAEAHQLYTESRRGNPERWRWVGSRAWSIPSGANAFILGANPGSYTLTGVSADVDRGVQLNAAAGAYTNTGVAAPLNRGRPLNSGNGAYAVSGQVTANLIGHVVNNAAGSYALTGAGVTSVHGYDFLGGSGSYGLIGAVASFTYTRRVTLPADPGAYSISGKPTQVATGTGLASNLPLIGVGQ